MPVADSIGGRLGASIWQYNPLLSVGIGAGLGAGAYAGMHTFAASEGSLGERSEASAQSAGRYFIGGALGLGALSIVANPRLGLSRGIGATGGSFIRNVPGRVTGFGRGVTSSYASGRDDAQIRLLTEAEEVPGLTSLRWSGVKGGVARVMEQQKLLMIGTGAGIGAMIGRHMDKDDPTRGAERGAAVGGGAGLALSAGMRANRVWGKFGFIGKTGAIGALTALTFGAASVMSRSRGQVDQADPEAYGMQARMNSMSATGDVVLGLHNAR